MRRALVLLLAALPVAGLAWAAAGGPVPMQPASADPGASPGEADARALLPRALAEARAYGDHWELVQAFAVEAAETPEWASSLADPRPGNGLAPEWHYLFKGPAGQAFAAIKADGARSAVGWAERAHPWTPAPVGAWRLGSAEALQRAGEDPRVREALAWPGLVLTLHLGKAPPTDAAHAREARDGPPTTEEQASWPAAWQGLASQHGAAQEQGMARQLAFRVDAATGAVEVMPSGMVQGEAFPPSEMPPPEHHGSIQLEGEVASLGPFARTAPMRIDPGAGGMGQVALDAVFQGKGPLPPRLAVRLLDETHAVLAEAVGESPLRLEAAWPQGMAYLEVALPDGEASLGTRYSLAGEVRQQWPPGAAGAWSWGLGGNLDPLTPSQAHAVPLDVPLARLHGVLQAQGLPEGAQLSVRLLGPDGAVLAEAAGVPPLPFDAAGLAAGTHTFEVSPVQAVGGAPHAGFHGYTLDLQGWMEPSPQAPPGGF